MFKMCMYLAYQAFALFGGLHPQAETYQMPVPHQDKVFSGSILLLWAY